ncbi:MAG: GNAT family N-acetyltransferase [Anaerolineae bacterium]
MAPELHVRRTRLEDVDEIAAFINLAKPGRKKITRDMVIERLSDVGFLIAEHDQRIVGLLGWQIENLVVRVTDFLIAPAVDRVVAGRALIEAMEEAARQLQAEVAILFLPPHPSEDLIAFWELFDYERVPISRFNRNWREVAREWNPRATEVMLKQLRRDLVNRPMW